MSRPTLADLSATGEFVRRHIGPNRAETDAMLADLGYGSLGALACAAMPAAIRTGGVPAFAPLSEAQALASLRAFAARNRPIKSMIGLGYSGTVTPATIVRGVIENPGWYTAYTPYQAEISQGRMEALLAFQQMTVDLTGLPVANASLLDEATAAAEAMTLMKRVARSESTVLFADAACHPQTLAVVRTRAEPLGLGVETGDPERDLDPARVFGVLVQYPDTTGAVKNWRVLAERIHAAGALLAVAADPLALALLIPPGEWGADVAVGSFQRFGVPMGFGGPHAAFMAVGEEHRRQIPGRLIGVSVDARGKPALRLALQTREQHIRREKATSNICTAQVLLANIAAFYAIYHGPEGVTRIALRAHRLAAILAAGLGKLGVAVENAAFFDTVTARPKGKASDVLDRARALGVNLRDFGDGKIGISTDETTTEEDLVRVWTAFGGKKSAFAPAELDAATPDAIPGALRRATPFLAHPVFNTHHSETAMMRFLKRLEDRDIALNRAMIPLGSCTMKLNAAAEMLPIGWPGFADVHPFVPLDQAEGYLAMIRDLEKRLMEITGFAAISLQPNAGSQGEYAGLLAIRKFHATKGQRGRDICLIPASAHGTNPASATLAGLSVVVVACDAQGNIDLADLRAKAAANRDRLAALMVTYPSTHGVFEAGIRDICRVVHDHGGQVYMDGANLNALVGYCRPAELGADVMHINLHKTFAIPHGGGGPGVGPIGVAAHLAPYLPNHPLAPEAGPASGIGPVAAAPWGSAGVLSISWGYIALMGSDGLKRATESALLAANYVAKRLAPHYPVLYTGQNGLVAHECILDARPLKESSGVTAEDIAKRLMDYGFHAPTMSFPVPGTLMVEPTESEPKAELDRFVQAMIAIRAEIARIERGDWPRADNPLKNAPHTADQIAADEWTHPYSREIAAFPLPSLKAGKYWPPVARVDNVYGDRHVVCTCPPIESYRDAAAE
ncbi:MAG: glycine dehydrogenase (aminomethyl-transferring) [Rhodospirillales bacterium]|nr:glycine dehydrogenase (aminomethyl-transferring) [Rhodospirillales bacterium]MSP79774.1 glycine dehydrogenase (aminomethyl-transferring) [Rhodospirillales bacterium]